MSAKFFTWTKGDRRNGTTESLRSSGIVPIPAECITIRGMDYARNAKGSTKAGRKPLPLMFDQSPPIPSSKHSSRTTESMLLQDAAVQSATTLMVAMNDMLRSPQLSAHLQQRSSGLAPMHNRPRSHTAPSTPLAEAPYTEIAELPGSLLTDRPSKKSLRHSTDGRAGHQPPHTSSKTLYGGIIERPHSSPQELTHNVFSCSSPRCDSVTRIASTYPPPQLSIASTRTRHSEAAVNIGTEPQKSTEDLTSNPSNHSSLSINHRPSLATIQKWRSKSPSISGSIATSNAGSTTVSAPLLSPSFNPNPVQMEHSSSMNNEAMFLEQISLMRASHEAHLRSLREAHEKEIESHRSYIQFMERRNSVPNIQMPPSNKQTLTIDTCQIAPRNAERASFETSATTLQSFDSSLDNKKRASQESIAEIESLKRKLSICRKEQVETADIQRQRDQLRESADRSSRRITQLKNIVNKAKDNEKTMKASIADLEGRLEVANMTKVDVLEGFHDACEQTKKLMEKEKELNKQLEEQRAKVIFVSPEYASDSVRTRQASRDGRRTRNTRAISDAAIQSQHARPALNQTEATGGEVPTVITTHLAPDFGGVSITKNEQDVELTAKIAELESSLKKQKDLLTATQADCERYNSLLHSELRRQSRSHFQRTPALGPQIEAEAKKDAIERIRTVMKSNESSRSQSTTNEGEQSLPSVVQKLELELQACLKEILMYKLDVKGYKKDLRNAHAEIQRLRSAQETITCRLHTPESQKADCNVSQGATRASQERPTTPPNIATTTTDGKGTPDSGLGISLPHTPAARSVTSATVDALLAVSPPLMPETMPSPSRPKTPLGQHKKLPRPPPNPQDSYNSRPIQPDSSPSRAVSPKLQRGETLRSISDSIISSYAQRTTPEIGSAFTHTPPIQHARRSATAKSVSSERVDRGDLPLSKFTAEILRSEAANTVKA